MHNTHNLSVSKISVVFDLFNAMPLLRLNKLILKVALWRVNYFTQEYYFIIICQNLSDFK